MTHAERMAALVAAGAKIRDQGPFAVMNGRVFIGKFEINPDGRTATVEGDPTEAMVEGWPVWADFTCAAANARPSIALALEIVEALKLYRAATKQRAEDEREHCAAGLTYSIQDLVAIEERLDELLQRWEGKE